MCTKMSDMLDGVLNMCNNIFWKNIMNFFPYHTLTKIKLKEYLLVECMHYTCAISRSSARPIVEMEGERCIEGED